jgi:hypothetical protein
MRASPAGPQAAALRDQKKARGRTPMAGQPSTTTNNQDIEDG